MKIFSVFSVPTISHIIISFDHKYIDISLNHNNTKITSDIEVILDPVSILHYGTHDLLLYI